MAAALKKQAQGMLQRMGLYHRARCSFLYDLYWSVAKPEIVREQQIELEFFRATLKDLPAGGLVFDIGANEGHKTGVFLALGASVVSVDPDPLNHRILRESFLSYRLRKKPVTIVPRAVSERSGRETFWIEEPGSGKNTLHTKWVETLHGDAARFRSPVQFGRNIEVETTTLEELIASHGRPYFIKIDVEGYEPKVLRGLRSIVPLLSFEVNLPEFKPEGLECVGELERLDPAGEYNFCADYDGGMQSARWLTKADFLEALENCAEPSIEVFWRSAKPK